MRQPSFRPARTLSALALAALFAVPSLADVYVVDDDGGVGVDFTDLPTAVAAVLPGDVLLVQPGTYGGFAASKGIAVLAQSGGVEVTSATRFTNVPAGQVVKLLGVGFRTLDLSGCDGVVVLDGVTVKGIGEMQALNVIDCADVRVIGSQALFIASGGTTGPYTGHGLSAFGARVEVVNSQLIGRDGTGSGFSEGTQGGHGAFITDDSRVHLVLSTSRGGAGGKGGPFCFPIIFAGSGGDGAQLQTSSTLFAMGTPSVSKLAGGPGGVGNPNCSNGATGDALDLRSGSFARHSGQTISGAVKVDATSTLEAPALHDPCMERIGTPLVGTMVRFNVYGEAGDEVTLFLGRNAVVQPLSGVLIEKLTTEERAFALGPIPAGGFATFVFPLPPWMSAGFTFYAQARVMRGSEELRTNSIPVVVR